MLAFFVLLVSARRTFFVAFPQIPGSPQKFP
jgi:hypothetical protein